MDRGALDQLLLHTGTLGSIYHKNPETFIRNATGKALKDSPALNAHSRAVLVPVARTQLPPTVVTVAGPGPSESHDRADSPPPVPPLPDAPVPSKPTPPVPPPESRESGDASYDDEGEADADDEPRGRSSDPYSNLDGAFGNYLADEPRPMNAGGRQGDDEDLLF